MLPRLVPSNVDWTAQEWDKAARSANRETEKAPCASSGFRLGTLAERVEKVLVAFTARTVSISALQGIGGGPAVCR
jgi:hypothetical protein